MVLLSHTRAKLSMNMAPGAEPDVGVATESTNVPLPEPDEELQALKQEFHNDECEAGCEELRKKSMKKRMTSMFEFSNAEAIKEKVRNQKKVKSVYNVCDAYHNTGFCQMIARHQYFENCTLAVIVVNALWISIDTDGNTAPTMNSAEPIYVVMDSLFFIYFTIEVIVRFLAFKRKLDCLKDGWFKFDITLVVLYGFDPFTLALIAKAKGGDGLDLPTDVLRLCRLARLSRLVRMLRSLPELMVMIKGMVTATSSVAYTLGLLMMVTYVFAIALRNLVPAADSEEKCQQDWGDDGCLENLYFSSVPEAMHNLIIYATFCDELAAFMHAIQKQSEACLILSWIYVSLASLTVMNMLVGVLCEVISAVASEETEMMMTEKVHEKFGALVEKVDDNNDGTISWDEFKDILAMPEALTALESVNVDPESMVDVAEDVFFDEGEPLAVPFQDFMALVLDLRGGQQATVENIMGLGKRFSQKFMNVNTRIENMERNMKDMSASMDQADGKVDEILSYLKVDNAVVSLESP